jgi:hypothetical protein
VVGRAKEILSTLENSDSEALPSSDSPPLDCVESHSFEDGPIPVVERNLSNKAEKKEKSEPSQMELF